MDIYKPCRRFSGRRRKNRKVHPGGEELTLSSKGESVISYADYAIAMVDEAENGRHFNERISVAQE